MWYFALRSCGIRQPSGRIQTTCLEAKVGKLNTSFPEKVVIFLYESQVLVLFLCIILFGRNVFKVGGGEPISFTKIVPSIKLAFRREVLHADEILRVR